jgi:hypothetical protein
MRGQWRKVKIAADTVICNAPCQVKSIHLYHSAATTADIFDEADDSKTAGNLVFTLANSTTVFHDFIDFGEEGQAFFEGLFIDINDGMVLVQYKYL